MRKDVILGMSIGGVMLAVVIVYLTVSTGGKSNKHQAQVDSGQIDGAGGAGDIGGQGGARELAETPIAPSGKGADTAKPVREKERAVATVTPPVTPKPADKPAVEPEKVATAADDAKPLVLTPTETEKTDKDWGEKLWGQQNTPLIGVSHTPDPNDRVAAAVERATGGRSMFNGTDSQGTAVVPSNGTAIVVPAAEDARSAISPTTKPSSGAAAPFDAGKRARQHTVQKGETFSTIALAAYGNASYYPFILRANQGLDPAKLKPGMVIVLPDASEVKPSEKEAVAGTGTRALPAGAKLEATIDAKSEYRVASGDNLHKIAQKLYGKTDMVQKIYELNKTAIGSDPAKLKLGMVLKLPEAPSQASAGTH